MELPVRLQDNSSNGKLFIALTLGWYPTWKGCCSAIPERLISFY